MLVGEAKWTESARVRSGSATGPGVIARWSQGAHEITGAGVLGAELRPDRIEAVALLAVRYREEASLTERPSTRSAKPVIGWNGHLGIWLASGPVASATCARATAPAAAGEPIRLGEAGSWRGAASSSMRRG